MNDDTKRHLLEAVLDDLKDMSPEDVAHHVLFWIAANQRWSRWADGLVKAPEPLMCLGDDGQREAITAELKRLEAARARTQEWLDRFQGEVATRDVRILKVKTRVCTNPTAQGSACDCCTAHWQALEKP